MKIFEKKPKNEPLRIPKTLKDELSQRPKVSPLLIKPSNEINLPEVINRMTPQKGVPNEDLANIEIKNNGRGFKDYGKINDPHKRTTSNSNIELYEKKSNNVFFFFFKKKNGRKCVVFIFFFKKKKI